MYPTFDALEPRLLWTVVSGVVFQDKNGNGRPDPGEGMPGCVVTYNENSTHRVGTFLTPADGSYSVILEPGTYDASADGPGVEQTFHNHTLVVAGDAMTVNMPVNGSAKPAAPPDLSVTVSQVQGTLLQGSTKPQPVTVTVTNAGKGAYSGPVTATVYFSKNAKIENSDLHVGPVTFPSVKLSAGTKKTFTFNAAPIVSNLPPGKWHVLVGLTNLSSEDTNPKNDTGSAKSPVTVAAPPHTNLRLALPGKLTLATGKQLKYTFQLKNTGNAAAKGVGNLLLAARPVAGGADVTLPPLKGLKFDLVAGKGSASGNLAVDVSSLPAGTYYLVATIVPRSLAPTESTTADNTGVSARTFVIP